MSVLKPPRCEERNSATGSYCMTIRPNASEMERRHRRRMEIQQRVGRLAFPMECRTWECRFGLSQCGAAGQEKAGGKKQMDDAFHIVFGLCLAAKIRTTVDCVSSRLSRVDTDNVCVCWGGARGQCEERAAALAGRRALLPWPPRTVLPLGGRLFRRYAGVDAFGFIVFNGHDIIVVEHLFRPCFCIIDTACGVYDSFL